MNVLIFYLETGAMEPAAVCPSHHYGCTQGFPNSSVVKNLPAMQETEEMLVQSLDWEDPLEEEMADHSSILA